MNRSRLLVRGLALAALLAVAVGCGTPGASGGPGGPIQTPAGVTPRGEPITSPVTSP